MYLLNDLAKKGRRAPIPAPVAAMSRRCRAGKNSAFLLRGGFRSATRRPCYNYPASPSPRHCFVTEHSLMIPADGHLLKPPPWRQLRIRPSSGVRRKQAVIPHHTSPRDCELYFTPPPCFRVSSTPPQQWLESRRHPSEGLSVPSAFPTTRPIELSFPGVQKKENYPSQIPVK